MNKHIVLVMKWLKDNDSVTKQELFDNRESAIAHSTYAVHAGFEYSAVNYATAMATCSAYSSHAAEAEKWLGRYFEQEEHSTQDYIQ